jgi:hypothetical protein
LRQELALGQALIDPLLGQAGRLHHLNLVQAIRHPDPAQNQKAAEQTQPDL